MSPTAAELLQQAMAVDEKERASIAGALIEDLHGPPDPGGEEAWAEEIRRRVAELDAGTVKTVPWSEVRERLCRGLE